MRAGQLIVDISMNVARLQQDVEQATGIVTSASKKIEGVANTAQKALAGIAAGFTVGAFTNMVRETVAMEAGLYKLAQTAGTTVEALSSIKGVAKQSDTSLETVAAGMQKLSKTMAEATDGTSKAAKVFTALGIATNDASGALRPSQVVMQELGQKLMQMKDQTLAVAFAQETMGKAGANLLPFLYELAQAGALQAKVTTEQAKAAQDFEDNLKKLEASGNKWKLHLVNEMIPGLVEFTAKLLVAQKETGNLAAAMILMLGGSRGDNAESSLRETEVELDAVTQKIERLTKQKSELNGLGGLQKLFSTDDIAIVNGQLAAAGIQQSLLMQRQSFQKFALGRQIESQPQSEWSKFLTSNFGGTKVANPLGKEGPPAPPPKDDFTPLAKSLDERIALMRAERDATQPLSEAQKELVKVQTDLTLGYKTLTPAQMETVRAKLAEVDALDQLLKYKAMQVAADKAELQRQKDRLNAQFTSIDATDAEISKLRESTQEVGLSASQLDRLRLSRIDDQIAIKERQVAQAEATSTDAAYIETLKIQVEQLEKLRSVTQENQFKTAVETQNKLQQDEFKRTSEHIQRSLTDALMRGFDSGKTFAQNLRDTTVNMFKTMILEPMIRPVAGAAANFVTSSLGFGGGAAGGGLGSLFSTASGANTMSGWFGGPSVAAGTFAGIGSTIIPGTVPMVAAGATEIGAGAIASGMGEAAAAGGAGMSIGAAMPYIGAALLAYSLLSDNGGGPKEQSLYFANDPGNQRFGADNITSQNPAFYDKVNAFSAQLRADYTPDQLSKLSGVSVGAAAGTDENALFSKLQQAVAGALAGVKSISQLAAETTAWGKALGDAKEALRAAQDPTGYWSAQVAKLQTQLGASASTLEDWRTQFLAALDASPDQETFSAWQMLGNALDQVSKAASKAAQTVALTSASFATLVDFTRYQRLVANGIQVDSRGIAIPHFAGGGDHPGGLRLVGERGPELEFTGPSRIMSNAASRNYFDATGIINAIAQLQASVRAENMAIVRNTSEVARLSKRWDGEGMPGLRVTDDAVRVNVTESVPVPVS
jgi:hypothetical protein